MRPHSVQSQPEQQTPQSKYGKRQVGNHIAKIGDAEKTALVREIVVCLRLRNPWQPKVNYNHGQGDYDQRRQARPS
jgi:hypothetical protein